MEDLQQLLENGKRLFSTIYGVYEQVNADNRSKAEYADLSIDQLAAEYKNLGPYKKLVRGRGGRKRAEFLIWHMAFTAKIYGKFGSGKVEEAWAFIEPTVRMKIIQDLEKEGGAA